MPARSTLPTTGLTGLTATDHRGHHTSLHTLYNAGGGGGRLMAAASNAPDKLKNRADYVCNGSSDQSDINAMLTEAGSVVLSTGDFYTSGVINVTENQGISGAGIDRTRIIGTANTYHVVHMGNRQADGVMRNYMALESLSVTSVGGANNFDTIWCDGFGNGSYLRNVKASEGKYNIRITDADQCYFTNIKAFNARTAGIYCEVGLENTWGNVAFYSPSVASSDASSTCWLFSNNANQSSPNRFDRVSIYGALFYANTGLASTVGLKMTVGASSFLIAGSLFENPVTHIQLDGQTQMVLIADSFIQNSGVSADILKCSTNAHSVTLQDCRFQQATNAFNGISGGANLCFLGRNTNQGNITNLFTGSFGSKQGTDTVFAGNGILASGLDNQRYDYGFFNNAVVNTQLRVGYSAAATAPAKTIVRKVGVSDGGGTSLGYIPVVDNARSIEHDLPIPSLRLSPKTVSAPLRGVNVAGAEFGTVGDAYGTSWAHESAGSFTYLASRGWQFVRYAFKWERLQPTLGGAFDAAEQARLVAAVGYIGDAGMTCVLNVHNYGKFNGIGFGDASGPTQAHFIDLWSKLSDLFIDNPTVVGYGLMNEPSGLSTIGAETGTQRWQTYSQAVVTALRAKGDTTCLLVGGYSNSSLPGWSNSTTNPYPWITDPIDNFRYEAHHYWDSSGGTYPNSYAAENTTNASWGGTDPTERKALNELKGWIDWLRRYRVKGFIGEYGWIRADTGANAADAPLWDDLATKWFQMCDSASDRLWLAYWSTGSKWSAGYLLKAYDASGGVMNAALSQSTVLEKWRTPGNRWTPDRQTSVVRFSDYITSATWWRGSSFDPNEMTGTSATPLGQPICVLIKLEEDGPLSNLIVYVGTSIVTPTAGQCFAAIFDDRGVQLGVSGDIGASLTQTANRSLAMTTPTSYLYAGQYVYGALLVNAATGPSIGRSSIPAGAISSRRMGLSGAAGQTTMPTTISPGSLTAAASGWWMGVS